MAPAAVQAAPAPAAAVAAPSRLARIGSIAMGALVFVNLAGTGFLVFRAVHHHAPAEGAAAPCVRVCGDVQSDTAPDVPGPTVALDPLVVNLAEPGSDRYLKIGLEAEVADQAALAKLNAAKTAVRDELIRYLSSLSVSQTVGESAKAKIQAELKKRIEKSVGHDRVKRIFVTDFVVQ